MSNTDTKQKKRLNYIKGTNIYSIKTFINFLLSSDNAVIKQRIDHEKLEFIFYIDEQFINDDTSEVLAGLSESFNNQLIFVATK